MLNKAYSISSFDYTLRLMMAYTRYTLVTNYLDKIKEQLGKRRKLSILDYGCGVSDIGLLFCEKGDDVTIADLDNKKFDFAIWRFKKREYLINTIKI